MARFKSNKTLVMAAARRGVVKGVNESAIWFQREVKSQLNLRASHRSGGGVPSPPGKPPAKMTGALSRSWQTGNAIISRDAQLKSYRVTIGSKLKYARIHEYGGTIRAKPGKLLTVPVHPSAKGKSARSFSDLVFIRPKGKNPILVRQKKGRGKSKNVKLDVMYVLVPRVTLPARPYVRPSLVNTEKVYKGIVKRAVELELLNVK